MSWRKNRKLASEGFRDLQYLPRERTGWDCTLASLAFGARAAIEGRAPDLNRWAARLGAPPSGYYAETGSDALVLWHGTSRERADKIREHGLFHKRGLWTTTDPQISHSFCRSRSERFGTDGAVLCLVIDRREIEEGRDYDLEGGGDIYRFRGGLPPEAVEYVLVHEAICFVGPLRGNDPAPWPGARFKRQSGKWAPVQAIPVRYSGSETYSTLAEFMELCVDRLLDELGEVTALDVFATLYAAVAPWRALPHEAAFDLIEEKCVPHRHRSKFQTFRRRDGGPPR